MSVLERLRSGSDSTAIQILLALVLASFVIYYGQDRSGQQGGRIATVNGRVLTDVEYQRRLRNLGRDLTVSDQEQVKKDLIAQEVVRQAARGLDLEVHKAEVAAEIFSIQAFHDETGKFDEKLYENQLKRMGYPNTTEFEALQHDTLLANKAREVAFASGVVSQVGARRAWEESQRRMTLSFVKVSPADFHDDVDLAADKLAAFAETNRTRIEQSYQDDLERLYTQPEQVTLSVIRVGVSEGTTVEAARATIDGLKAQIEGGADFGALAKASSDDPSALDGGQLPDAKITELDSGVVDAVKDLQPGQLAVVQDEAQVRLFRLEGRIAARTVPLDEARDAIARRLMTEDEAPALAATYAEDLLAAWRAQGLPPAELLGQQSLAMETTGEIPTKPQTAPNSFTPPDELIEEAAKAEVGPLSRVFERGGVLWVAALDSRVEPDAAEFAANEANIRQEVALGRGVSAVLSWQESAVAAASVR